MAIYQTSKETITNTFKTYLLNRPISTLHVLCSEHSEEEYMTSMKVCILTTDRRPTSHLENSGRPFLQQIMWSISCLFQDRIFRGQWIKWRYFQLNQIQYIGENNVREITRLVTSPPLGMTAIHTCVSTEYLPTWSILTAAGHATGPEISASLWLNCVWAILHCWRPTCTTSDVETPPLVHIAMVLTKRQNIWCYTAQHTTRRGGSHGQISTIKATQDAYGASWRRSGRWPVPPTGNERERERSKMFFVSALPGTPVCILSLWDFLMLVQLPYQSHQVLMSCSVRLER